MGIRNPYSIITNFGYHFTCPYCVTKKTGIKVEKTDMRTVNKTVDGIIRDKEIDFLSVSGGGDPLWLIDDERKAWYRTLTERCVGNGIESELHTSMLSLFSNGMTDDMGFDRVVFHLLDVRQMTDVPRLRCQTRVVFVVIPSMDEQDIDEIADIAQASGNIDQLTFRQLINPDYSIDHTCEAYLKEGHQKRWWYVTQGDYNTYIVNDRILYRFKTLRG